MAITGMAVKAGFAHGCRTQTFERSRVFGDVAFEEEFSVVKFSCEPLGCDCWRFVLVTTCKHIICCSKLPSWIPF